MFQRILAYIRKSLTLVTYSGKSKSYDDSNKLVVGKVKDETTGVAIIKEFVGLKPNLYSFLVDGFCEHKKAKSANKNVEYK